MKKLFMAIRAEYHWSIIRRCRQKLTRLFEKGEPLTSNKMIDLDKKITNHGVVATQIDEWFRGLDCKTRV